MALVKDTIANFIGGVSQQPNKSMFAHQSKKLINQLLSPIDGLLKRPPTEHITRLMDSQTIHPLVHTIIKEDGEYTVIFTNNDVKVFTLGGVQKNLYYGDIYEVTDGTHTGYIDIRGAKTSYLAAGTVVYSDTALTTKLATTANATEYYYTGNEVTSIKNSLLNYITSTDPLKELYAITLADYTFILNKTIATALMTDKFTNPHAGSALIFVKQGNYGTDHKIKVNGTEVASYTTSTTDLSTTKTNNIATNLYNNLVSNLGTTDWTITQESSCILLKKKDGTDFTILSTDSNGNRDLFCFYKETDSSTDLPLVAPDGFVIKIVGNGASNKDDYYLQFSTSDDSTFGQGTWKECCSPDLQYKIDATTMPIALVRESDGDFSLKHLKWTNRGAGDENSAKTPSFIGNAIQEVFTHKGRIALLSVDKSIYSDVNDIFSFFKKTTLTELDSDPIDVSSNSKMVLLKHSLPFKDELLMFSELAEFSIKGGDVFSNSTVAIDLSMEYSCSSNCKPINAGATAFFVFENGEYSKLYEIYTTSTYILDSREVTSQVPRYIPKNVYKIVGSTANNIALLLTTEETDAIYVHNYYYTSEQKAQSAWSKWTFNNAKILNADFHQNYLYLTIQYEDGIYFEKMNFSPKLKESNLDFLFFLDRKVYLNNGVYNSTTKQSTFTLPYTPINDIKVVDSEGFPLDIISLNNKQLIIDGNYTNIVIGNTYSSNWIPSTIYLRQTTQNGSVKVKEGLLMLRDINLCFAETGYFKVVVTPKYTSQIASEFEYTGKKIGMTSATLGKIPISDDTQLIPIVSKNEDIEIEIINDSYLPSCFLSLEWLGDFTTRDA